MKRRRLGRRRQMRALAIQAGVVLVCAGVLYAAFLRPDGSDELSGITADGTTVTREGERHGAGPRGGDAKGKDGKDRNRSDRGRDRDGKKNKEGKPKHPRDADLRGIRPAAPAFVGGSPPVVSVPPSRPAPPPAGQGPPANQYSDTVSAIRARLAEAGG